MIVYVDKIYEKMRVNAPIFLYNEQFGENSSNFVFNISFFGFDNYKNFVELLVKMYDGKNITEELHKYFDIHPKDCPNLRLFEIQLKNVKLILLDCLQNILLLKEGFKLKIIAYSDMIVLNMPSELYMSKYHLNYLDEIHAYARMLKIRTLFLYSDVKESEIISHINFMRYMNIGDSQTNIIPLLFNKTSLENFLKYRNTQTLDKTFNFYSQLIHNFFSGIKSHIYVEDYMENMEMENYIANQITMLFVNNVFTLHKEDLLLSVSITVLFGSYYYLRRGLILHMVLPNKENQLLTTEFALITDIRENDVISDEETKELHLVIKCIHPPYVNYLFRGSLLYYQLNKPNNMISDGDKK